MTSFKLQVRSSRLIGLAAIAATAIILAGLSSSTARAQTGGGSAPSSQPAFIKNLHITGFVQNTSATWVNSSAVEYNTDRWGKLNRNSLAAERNLLQIEFLRAWGVY